MENLANENLFVESSNDIKYKQFIKGKRVVFVGPSPCILGESNGELIDSFDVVIRTNGSFPVNPLHTQDYGKRCDSLYVNELYAKRTNLPINEYLKRELRFLNLKKDRYGLEWRYKHFPLKIRKIESKFSVAQETIGAPPLMGTYIIWEILNMSPQSIYLTGMDCYNKPNTNTHYINGYLPYACNIKKLDYTRVNLHKQEIQNLYLQKLIESRRVDADSHLLKSLGL